MFEKIEKYIIRNLEERQNHLDLDSDCIEIGGHNSTEYRGLLAHYLKTTIPSGSRYIINLCHACGNHKCSNPNHLYWGTVKENHADMKKHGTFKNLRTLTIEKYGLEEAEKIFKKAAKKGGKNNKGRKILSQEKINFYKDKIMKSNPGTYGWVTRASNLIGVSHTQVRRIYNKYL